MIVKLISGTKENPGAEVHVELNVKFKDVAAFDRWVNTQWVARDWLQAQLSKRKESEK